MKVRISTFESVPLLGHSIDAPTGTGFERRNHVADVIVSQPNDLHRVAGAERDPIAPTPANAERTPLHLEELGRTAR